MHMHLDETAYQREYARRRTGGTAAEHLDRLGLLGPRLTLGHGVWLTERDVDRVGGPRRHDLHQSQLEPPPPQRHRAREPLPGGRRAARDRAGRGRHQRRPRHAPGDAPRRSGSTASPGWTTTCRPAPRSSAWRPSDGAATTPFGDRLGVLAAGRAADLVLLPWRAIAHPYLEAGTPVLDAVVHRARAAAIDTVLVGRGGRAPGGTRDSRRQGRRARGAVGGAPATAHSRRGASPTAVARPVPARSPLLRRVARSGVARSLLPAELAVVAGRGARSRAPHVPGQVVRRDSPQGARCRKRSAQARASRRDTGARARRSARSRCLRATRSSSRRGSTGDRPRGPPPSPGRRSRRPRDPRRCPAFSPGGRRTPERRRGRRAARPRGRVAPNARYTLAHVPAPGEEHDRRVHVEGVEALEPVRPRRQPLGARRVGHQEERAGPPHRAGRAPRPTPAGRSRCDA